MVPSRSISALPHSLHVPSPSRQVVACYHPQCAARCCTGSVGPALPHQPRLFYETCSQGTGQQWEEEKLDHTPAIDCRGILHAVTRLMFSGDSRCRTNFIKHKIFQPKTERKCKNAAVRLNCSKSVTSRSSTPCMNYWTLIRRLFIEVRTVIRLHGFQVTHADTHLVSSQTKTNLDHTGRQHNTGEWQSSLYIFLCRNPHHLSLRLIFTDPKLSVKTITALKV